MIIETMIILWWDGMITIYKIYLIYIYTLIAKVRCDIF